MALIAVVRGPRQGVRGASVYDVVKSPVPADLVVVGPSEYEMVFARGSAVQRAYFCDTITHWDDEKLPGVTRFAFVAALPGTPDFRQRYQAHAEIARVQHPAICRYVQHFVRHGTEPVCAAISELHFHDEESMRTRFYRDGNSAAVVDADIRDYLDRDRTWSIVSRFSSGSR
ncbi:MAG: hypothetical protein ACJ735_08480 [Actinomycetes bacterium]